MESVVFGSILGGFLGDFGTWAGCLAGTTKLGMKGRARESKAKDIF
jgi:hypothetical protein